MGDLSRAEVVGADLRGANLESADLSGILTRPRIPADLQIDISAAPEVRFGNAILAFADLSAADLRDVEFTHADLRYVKMARTDCRHADFTGANLFEADLNGADLRGARYNRKTTWPP